MDPSREESKQQGADADSAVRWALVVTTEAGRASHVLPEQGEVTIGRSEKCQIRVDDPRLSRQHVVLRVGPRVEVVDLGSMNGTTLRGARLPANQPTALAEGDTLHIGSSELLLQRRRATSRVRRLLTHGYFEARLEEECLRAEQKGSAFAVVRVVVKEHELIAKGELLIAELTTPTDVVGIYLHGEYEVLLVDSPVETTEAFVAKVRERFAAAAVPVEVSFASFPRDGRTPEALVARLSGAGLRETFAEEPERLALSFKRFESMIKRIAPSTIGVLVLGETGVGKEVLARAIHDASPRASKPFLAVNCAGFAENLLESELFGYERGAFTGAAQAKPGLLESAEGGTVLLDEVGEMPLQLQSKLLRVLEQREVMRIGSLKPKSIDVRFIAATNRDLEAASAAGTFRQDLYFRLNGVSFVIPPLRERPDEIAPLAAFFVQQALRRAGRSGHLGIDPDSMTLLREYQWPGNIRELRNAIERAVLLCSGGSIGLKHLPVDKMGRTFAPPPPPPAPRTMPPVDAVSRPTLPSQPSASVASTAPAHVSSDPPTETELDVEPTELERARVILALEQCAGNQTRAAKVLGISRRTLVTWLQKYNVPRPRKP